MTIYINQNLNVAGNITGDWITFGDGAGDYVQAGGDITQDVISFGSGAGDFVLSRSGNISNDIIVFGNGVGGDLVGTNGNINNDAISFGNGDLDYVSANSIISSDVLTFGNGTEDRVDTEGGVSNSIINFGSGPNDGVSAGYYMNDSVNGNYITFHDRAGTTAGDFVVATTGIGNNSIAFGNGGGDNVTDHGTGATLTNNTINFGNGNDDYVMVAGPSGYNKITLGNGQNDSVTLGPNVTNQGGDYIATGTGAGDSVIVGPHTTADTFAFALGTGASAYTTISGNPYTSGNSAQICDQIAVNGGQLGNTLVNVNTVSPGDTMATFISHDVGTPIAGHTYIGNNGIDTFIYTDTQTGQKGAIEVVGVFGGSIENHVLTLLATAA